MDGRGLDAGNRPGVCICVCVCVCVLSLMTLLACYVQTLTAIRQNFCRDVCLQRERDFMPPERLSVLLRFIQSKIITEFINREIEQEECLSIPCTAYVVSP